MCGKICPRGRRIALSVSHHCLRVSFQVGCDPALISDALCLVVFSQRGKGVGFVRAARLRCRWSDDISAAGQEDEVSWSHAVVVAEYTLIHKSVDKVCFGNIHRSDEGTGGLCFPIKCICFLRLWHFCEIDVQIRQVFDDLIRESPDRS